MKIASSNVPSSQQLRVAKWLRTANRTNPVCRASVEDFVLIAQRSQKTVTPLKTLASDEIDYSETNSKEGSLYQEYLDTDFFSALNYVGNLSIDGEMPDIDVLYDHINIFGPLDRGFIVRHIGIPSVNYKPFIQDYGPDDKEKILSFTFWWNKIKPSVRSILRTRYLMKKDRLIQLKEILHSVDAIINSLLFAAPTYPWSWNTYDRLVCSIISNLVFSSEYLIRWKKYKKLLRKWLLSEKQGEPPQIRREFSWVAKFVPYLNVDSRLGVMQVLSFCQTRNTGIPDSRGDQRSIDKFVKTVTTPSEPRQGEPIYDKLVLRLAQYATANELRNLGKCAHLSLSTTSCVQNSVSEGGKAGFAQALLTSGRIAFKFNLTTGEPTESKIDPVAEPGPWLFHYSCHKLVHRKHHDISDTYICNLSIIREPGPKWRVITASDFYHAQFLQPWSHLTLELLKKVPQSRSGISKSRHGWEMYTSLTPDDPNLAWLFDERLEKAFTPLGLSTDLEEATDFMPWETVAEVVDALNFILGIPRWYGSMVKECLTTQRLIMYKGKLIAKTVRACLMGDPGCKSILTCLGIYVSESVMAFHGGLFFYRVIGDDYAAISPNRRALEMVLSEYKRIGMKISEDDTYISAKYIYFTEEVIRIPRRPHQAWSHIEHSRLYGHSCYIDAIKGRLLLDVRKNRDDFSYTPGGRIDLLGHDIEYLKVQSDPIGLFHMASLVQDVCLHTESYGGFVYFPRSICGSGKVPLFGKMSNAIRFWIIHCRGRYSGQLCTLIVDALRYVGERSIETERSDICRYANTGVYRHDKNHPWKVYVKPIEEPAILAQKVTELPVESGIVKDIMARINDFVISESEVCGRLAKNEFVRSLVTGIPANEEQFSLKTLELRQYDDELLKDAVTRFFEIWLSDPRAFIDFRTDMYFNREPVEQILGVNHPLYVEIPLYSQGSIVYNAELPKRVDRESLLLHSWFTSAIEAKRLGEPLPPIPRSILADDSILFAEIIQSQDKHIFVITQDFGLVERIAKWFYYNHPEVSIYRIPVRKWLFTQCAYKHWGEPMTWRNHWIDLGSYDAYMAKHGIVGVSNLDPKDFMKDSEFRNPSPGTPFSDANIARTQLNRVLGKVPKPGEAVTNDLKRIIGKFPIQYRVFYTR